MPVLVDGSGHRILVGGAALSLGTAATTPGGSTPGGGVPIGNNYTVPASIPLRLKAHGAGMAAGSVVTTWPAFAYGHLPAGSHLVVTAGGITVPVQQDSETFWGDGSVRAARLAFRLPVALAAETVATLQVTPTTGAPDRTALITPQALVAAKDVTLRSYGGDAVAVTFITRLRDIVTNGQRDDWGSNPVQGWDVPASGPTEVVVRGWRMRHDSGQALTTGYHGWVRDWIYLSYRVDGTYELFARSEMGNWDTAVAGGAVSIGTGTVQQMVTACELYDGSTLVAARGGPSDPRTVTQPASTTFNTGANTVNLPAGYRSYQAVTFAAASGGALPSGLVSGKVYFLGGDGGLFNARTDATGKTGGARVAFGTAGSGNVVVTPMAGVWNGSALLLAATDGRPFLLGAARVDLGVAWDEDYLSAGARLFPCYDTLVHRYPSNTTTAPDVDFFPNAMPWGPWLNTTGDNPGDNRIGTLNQAACLSHLSPLDAAFAKQARVQACGWADQPIWWSDPRSGRALALGNGPDDAGALYPRMGPNRVATSFNGGSTGQDGWVGHTGGYFDGYSSAPIEASHMPTPWVVPCVHTGSYIFADMGVGQVQAADMYNFNTDLTVGPVHFYRVLGMFQQTRGSGWLLNCAGFAEFFTPGDRPEAAWLKHVLDGTANYYAGITGAISAAQRNQGIFHPELGGDCGFFYYIWALAVMLAVWRGNRSAWLTTARAQANAWAGLIDDASATGGSGYVISGAYHPIGGQDPQGKWRTLRDIIASDPHMGASAGPYPATGMLPLNADPILGSSFMAPAPYTYKSTDYATIALAAMAVGKACQVVSLNGDDCAAVHDALKARMNTAPCTGQEYSFAGAQVDYPVWAIVAPS